MTPPFTVLSVCMGNICRSPMSERLLVLRLREALGDDAERVDDLLLSHSCGLGSWHVGEGMTEATADVLRERGGEGEGFRSRQIGSDKVDISDLILTATTEQVDYIRYNHPEALERTFLVRHFAALLDHVDERTLPAFDPEPEAFQARGVAIVKAVDALRDRGEESELDDPWGLDLTTYRRIADELDAALVPFAALLTGGTR
ncbi:phosphotyrosine protein phosphatase [Phytomonospora sp. NPDC050363]|uniref:arsenate reductase/protein-tyrosine-phosphatase family protein n=1 Tax=Phytomonospora sp. NPDC050363 TaxID=3155642 RepID=UPI0033F57EEC